MLYCMCTCGGCVVALRHLRDTYEGIQDADLDIICYFVHRGKDSSEISMVAVGFGSRLRV